MSTDTDIAVDLYVRAASPCPEERDTIISTLTRLEADQQIDNYTIHLWPKTVPLASLSDSDSDWIPSLYQTFRSWAAEQDLSLQPAFTRREFSVAYTGSHERRLQLPVHAMAVYIAQSLLAVYPHTDDGTVQTVADGLAALERGDLRERPISGDSDNTTNPDPVADTDRMRSTSEQP